MIDEQLTLILLEWKNSLIDGSFVSDAEFNILKRRLITFFERNIHIEDDEFREFINDANDFIGG